MKVTLINPLFDVVTHFEGISMWYNKKVQPLSLLSIASLLREYGNQPEVIDANLKGIRSDSVFWSNLKTDVVVLTTSSLDNWQCPFLDIKPIKNIVERIPEGIPIILTGAHGTTSPEFILNEIKGVTLVKGEPEWTTLNLIETIKSKKDYSDLKGIAFFKDEQFINNPLPETPSMDEFRIPAYDLVEMPKYEYELMGDRFSIMETSRGCPYRCNFCLLAMYRKKYETRNFKLVLDEVELLIKEYGVKRIYFYDLEFLLPRQEQRAEAFCRAIAERKLNFEWAIQTRVDSVNDRILKIFKKSGCTLIHYGVESGNPTVLERTNKGINVNQIQEAFRLTKKNKIKTLGYFTIGHPTESREQIYETIQFAKKLNPDYASFVVAIPFVGTQIYQKKGDAVYYPTCSQSLTEIELESLRKKAIREFYLRPAYIARKLFGIKSFKDFNNLFKGFGHILYPLLK